MNQPNGQKHMKIFGVFTKHINGTVPNESEFTCFVTANTAMIAILLHDTLAIPKTDHRNNNNNQIN